MQNGVRVEAVVGVAGRACARRQNATTGLPRRNANQSGCDEFERLYKQKPACAEQAKLNPVRFYAKRK